MDDTMPHTLKPALENSGVVRQISAERLQIHIERLAGEIGERNIFQPEALRAAAAYIGAPSSAAKVTKSIPYRYDLSGTPWVNLGGHATWKRAAR